MIRYYILNEKGTPIEEPDLLTWARWFETANNRVVAKAKVAGSVVSTVFLGLDHSLHFFGGARAPILYETLVFGGPLDEEGERYLTKQQALKGHAKWIRRVRAA